MRRSRKFEDESTTAKSLIIFGLIFILFFATSIALTSYPQHLAINEKTVIQTIKFIGNNTAIIRGNQVQYGTGDVISIQGRDYIRITGNQVQIGKSNYPEAVRTIVSEWYQNILFTQKVGSFKSNQTAQIIIDSTSFVLTPLSQDTISVTATNILNTKNQNHYNIVFKAGTVYINENGIMLKFTKTEDVVIVNTVGFDRHNKIAIRAI
ncbi:MAG: hypothetical protein PHW62_00245 [Candidatus Ratteibacteria bacterium]|nr:hypothetical protein [Candidatus Ratteibacteria bacterium]